MLAVYINLQSVLLAKLTKGFLSRKKELILTSSTEALKGKKAVVILPADTTYIFQETITSREQLRESFKRHLEELKIEENQAIYFSTKIAATGNSDRHLLIVIDKAKLAHLLQKAKQINLKIEGFLPEPVVLQKLLVNEIAGDEKRLILNIGEEESRIYLLGRFGPVRVLSETISTSKLIPETQKLLKESPEIEKVCSLGVFFGEKSLAFDEKVFEEQTGIKLVSAGKVLSVQLNKAEITLETGEILKRFVSVAAAVILFNNKEIIKLDEIDLSLEGRKPIIAKPAVQRFVVKEKRFPTIRLILISFGVAFIVAGLVLGVLRLRSSGLLPGQGEAPTTVPTQIQLSPTPTLTPAPTVNPKDIKVRVLNGSGVAGSASIIADALKEESFDVIKIGNADSFDFVETEIRYKEGEQEKVNLVIESLKEREIATPEASLELDDEVDVEVIIGHE